jgi:hypothetical protein
LWRIKIARFATFGYGHFQAPVVLFPPRYLRGIARERTIVLPGPFASECRSARTPSGGSAIEPGTCA